MKRTIITYGGYFERFMMTLNAAERRKIDYILSLLESGDRVPVKFMRLIRDGLIVVLFNVFSKKSQKTPQKEIDKAFNILKSYYADKRS